MREEVYLMIRELYATLPFELTETPTLEQAAHNWLLCLITRDQHRSNVVSLVLEEAEQKSEWFEEVMTHDNADDLIARYAEAYEIIRPFLDRLARLK